MRGAVRGMRDKHWTSEEIIKYMDASDLSEEYMLWLEDASEHILTCGICQEKLNRAMTIESVCDEEGLAAGFSLMEHEEEIRKNILIAHLSRMQEQARIAELIRHIQNGYVERFLFSLANLQSNAGAVRGEKPQCGQRVMLEKSENKLLLKISGEMGKESKAGTEEIGNQERQRSLMVVLRIEDGEPIVKEALWDEACGQYIAVVDDCESGEELEVYILENADESEI